MKLFKFFLILTSTFALAISFKAQALEINGVALHSELGDEQFIAALLTERPTTDARDIVRVDQDQRITMKLLPESISPRRLRRRWIEGIAVNARPSELAEQADNMARFSQLLNTQFFRGDEITAELRSGVVSVSANGVALGTIDDANFYKLLIRIFVGTVPVSSTVKESLLAGGKVSNELLARYNEVTASPSRVNAMQVFAENLGNDALLADSDSAAEQEQTASAQGLNSEKLASSKKTSAKKVASKPPAKKATPKPKKASTPKPTPRPVRTSKTQATQTTQLATVRPIRNDNIASQNMTADDLSAESILTQQLYVIQLKRWTLKHTRYPSAAQRRNQEGSVQVKVVIDRKGEVQTMDILSESKHASLNKAALKAIDKASPYPPVPQVISDTTFEFTAPFSFKLAE